MINVFPTVKIHNKTVNTPDSEAFKVPNDWRQYEAGMIGINAVNKFSTVTLCSRAPRISFTNVTASVTRWFFVHVTQTPTELCFIHMRFQPWRGYLSPLSETFMLQSEHSIDEGSRLWETRKHAKNYQPHRMCSFLPLENGPMIESAFDSLPLLYFTPTIGVRSKEINSQLRVKFDTFNCYN